MRSEKKCACVRTVRCCLHTNSFVATIVGMPHGERCSSQWNEPLTTWCSRPSDSAELRCIPPEVRKLIGATGRKGLDRRRNRRRNVHMDGKRVHERESRELRTFGRHGARKLPKPWRSLQDGQRFSPGRSRKPWVRASMVRDRVQTGEARPAFYGTVGDEGGSLCSARRAPAFETVRLVASTSRGLAEFLSHPSSRRNRQTNESTNVQRYTRAGRSLGPKTGPFLEGPQWPRIEKTVVALHLSNFLTIFQKGTADLTLPPVVLHQRRHSGPSIGKADGSPTLEQVKKARAMASHENSPTIRETLPVRTKLGNPARKSPTASPALRRTPRGCVARRPAHGSSGTWWPLLKGHFVTLIDSGTRQVSNELKKQEITARVWTGDELAEPNAFRSLAHDCKNGPLRAAFVAPHGSEESMILEVLDRLRF